MEMLKRCKGAVAAMLAACSMAAALCTGGCATLPPGCTPVVAKNVVFHSQRLANDIEIIDLKGTMAGDLLKVQASLRISPRSKDPDMVPFMYRFYWFDAEGKEVAAVPGEWQPYIIFGRAAITVQGVAPDPRARDFRLVIKGPEDSHC